MEKRTLAFAGTLGTGRGGIRAAVAAAVLALTPLVVAQRADAQYSITADSDGYVPVYDVCFAGGTEVGYYSWYNDGYTTTGEISIDSCLLESLGGGPGDYDRVLAHEQGHAAGYGHSSDPNSIMYPYTYILQGGEQYETPEPEQYETEQYDAAPTPEVQQYEPEQEAEEPEEAPDIREVPREEQPPVRTGAATDEAGKKAEEEKEGARKKDAERDEAVDRVRVEAAALARSVEGADTLTEEEPRDRAEALAGALEKDEAGAKDGPLAEAREQAKGMAESLAALGERKDEPPRDRARAIAETREKAEDLAGTLDRAGDGAGNEARASDFAEASVKVRNIASKLDGAETEMEDQETEQRQPVQETPPAEVQNTEKQNAGTGFFARIREFFASTFG